MRMSLKLIMLGAVACSGSGLVQAQQPGTPAYNSVFLPAHGVGDTRQGAPVQWGAFASGKRGAMGWVLNGASEDEASGQALSQCVSGGGEDCSVDFTFANECAVVATSSTNWHWLSGPSSLKSLRKETMQNCARASAGGRSECQFVWEGCAR